MAKREKKEDVVLRGTKMRIYPSERQAALMDTWRRRCISLWNLLLDLETAAYGAKNTRSKIGWRSIWARVVEENYAKSLVVYHHGKCKKDGSFVLNRDGTVKHPPRERFPGDRKILLGLFDALRRALDTSKGAKCKCDVNQPYALTRVWLEDAGHGARTADIIAWLKGFEGECDCTAVSKAAKYCPEPPTAEILAKIKRTAPADDLPVDQAILLDLFGFLRGSLKKDECDHTHDRTLAWLEKHELAESADDILAWLKGHGGTCDCKSVEEAASHCPGPRLFIWEHELAMIMARLKAEPRTEWIGDLPSHAAQMVVKDLIKALQTMLKERAKASAGDESARKTGFPKFKKQAYASGSVYFPNTTMFFDVAEGRVQLPNGCGSMRCEIPRQLVKELLDRNNIKPGLMIGAQLGLLGGRIWRQGDRWYLSCQWERPRPALLPMTGRTAGVKIAAKIVFTTFDNRGQTKEYTMPRADKKLAAVHLVAATQNSKALEMQKLKEKKIKASKERMRLGKLEKGYDPNALKPLKRPRVRRSRLFYRSAARLAACEAIERDRRDGFLHRVTNEIVHKFDAISVQKMSIAPLMQRQRQKEKQIESKKNAAEKNKEENGAAKKPRNLKPVRKLLRHVAMARGRQLLEYKFNDLRGPGSILIADSLEPEVQICSRCGTKNPQMKDGRRLLRCIGVLPDGTDCNAVLPRNRNAARNAEKRLRKYREKQNA